MVTASNGTTGTWLLAVMVRLVHGYWQYWYDWYMVTASIGTTGTWQ